MDFKSPDTRWLIAIAAIALILRVAVGFLTGGNPLVHDSTVYLFMAAAIVEGEPVASFPNGYPLLLAVPRILLSQRELIPFVIGMNVLSSTAAVVITWLIGRKWLGSSPFPALMAALFLAVFPHQLRYVQLVMSEVPAQLLVLVAIWLLFESIRDSRWNDKHFLWHRFGAGFLLHMTVSVRPSFSFAFPLLIALLLIKRLPWRGTAVFGAGFFLGALLLFGTERVGIVKPPVAPANNLLIAITSNSSATQFKMFPMEEQRKAVQTYVRFAATQPAKFLRQRAESFWELWGPWSLPGYRNSQEGMLIKAILLLRPLLLGAALWGWWRRRDEIESWILGLPVIGLTVVHVLTFSNHRFIAPIEPFLALLIAGIWKPRNRRTIPVQ